MVHRGSSARRARAGGAARGVIMNAGFPGCPHSPFVAVSAFGEPELLLQPGGRLAIVPAPLRTIEPDVDALDAIPVLSAWVRGALLGIVTGLTAIFGIAAWLNPYDGDG